MAYKITVNHNGNVELCNSDGEFVLTACVRHCVAEDLDGNSMHVHYIAFESHAQMISEHELNNQKLAVIKFYVTKFQNNMLFRSSSKQPNKLYKYIDNTKGKEFVLVPRLNII